jgi:plastocyanin
MRTARVLAVVTLVVLGITACGSDDPVDDGSSQGTTTTTAAQGGEGGSAITIENAAFAPSTLRVSAGTKVTVENKDAGGHTWTADEGDLFDEALSGGATASHTVADAGTFTYHCEIHSSMKGAVVVS